MSYLRAARLEAPSSRTALWGTRRSGTALSGTNALRLFLSNAANECFFSRGEFFVQAASFPE